MREAVLNFSDAELEALGFAGLVDRLRDAGVRDAEMVEDYGDWCVPQVTVGERLDAAAIEDFECVDECELVSESDGEYVYLLELTATELPDGVGEDHDDLLGNCEATVTDRGVVLSLVGSQEAIRGMLRNFEAAGATPDLCELSEYDGTRDALDALTDRQLEVLETAYRMGFYEIPREASTDDVARELGLDDATVSEHLQRAERNLLAQQLSP